MRQQQLVKRSGTTPVAQEGAGLTQPHRLRKPQEVPRQIGELLCGGRFELLSRLGLVAEFGVQGCKSGAPRGVVLKAVGKPSNGFHVLAESALIAANYVALGRQAVGRQEAMRQDLLPELERV